MSTFKGDMDDEDFNNINEQFNDTKMCSPCIFAQNPFVI